VNRPYIQNITNILFSLTNNTFARYILNVTSLLVKNILPKAQWTRTQIISITDRS
jgi:hypothetical protein